MDKLVTYLQSKIPFLVIEDSDRIEVSAWDPLLTYLVSKNLCEQTEGAVTGGSKLMAFGALQTALEKGKAVVYVDNLA